MVKKSKLDEDEEGKAVDPLHSRGMIGTLLYLTASRPDLQFAICMCARILLLHYQHLQMRIMLVAKILAEEQVQNEVVDLYFVRTEYQLLDIFTKPLVRERLKFLIKKLGMQCMSPETLKKVANEEEE
nr:hypothetical protein [Tanacetum cinerariifolium]